jgi:hypothetical protein
MPNAYKGSVWLPAKNLHITESWSADTTGWEIGNPISRTITIEAEELLAEQLPDLSIKRFPGMNIYVDPPHRSNHIQGNSVIGTLQQKVTYIPKVSQSITLPALTLNWWNTQTNIPAIAQLKPIAIQVIKILNNSVSQATMPPMPQDTIKLENQSVKNMARAINSKNPFYYSIWFWTSIMFLIAWLLTLWFVFRKKMNVKKTSLTIKAGVKASDSTLEFNEKQFSLACKQGDSLSAQRYLLAWAKIHWLNPPHNLTKLREEISDETFKIALEKLEQSIYANNNMAWDGHVLFAAYQKTHKLLNAMKRSRQKKNLSQDKNHDPLLSLNP